MLKRLLILDENLLIHLSIDHYQLNLINQHRQTVKIQSQQKIIFYTSLITMNKSYMQKNSIVFYYYLFIVDSNYTWCLFRIKNGGKDVMEIYRGKILSQKYQLKEMIGVAEIDGKLLLIFSGFRIVYLLFPQEDQVGKQIMTKQYIPYGGEPSFQHQNFAITNGYLPNEQQNQCISCHYNKISPKTSIFILIYRSIIYKLYSIFTIEYDHTNNYFMSGKSTLYNIQYQIVNIFSTVFPHVYLIQTKQNIIRWDISKQQEDNMKYQIIKISFKSTLSILLKNNIPHYLGITSDNKLKQLSINPLTKQLSQQTLIQPILSQHLQTIYQLYSPSSLSSSLNLQDLYLINNKLQLLSYIKKDKIIKTIIFNQNIKIISSKLYLNENFNYIVVEKIRGKMNQIIVYGNHMFTYGMEGYMHGMLFSMANIVSWTCSKDKIQVVLTSPLIGLQQLTFSYSSIQPKADTKGKATSSTKSKPKTQLLSISSDKSFQFSLDPLNPKLTNDESFFLTKKYQITSSQITQLQSQKTINTSKLFQDSIQYLTNAIMIGNDWIILSINDQIHIFDSKYKRKYIYCCNGQIKRLFSLNDVNVLGVQLFKTNLTNDERLVDNQLVVLILEEQKASKLKTISISNQYNYIQLSTIINTGQYKLNLFTDRLVICNNDNLHKYQLQKIIVLDYPLPLPATTLPRRSILPLFSYNQTQQKTTTNFLLLYKQQQTQPNNQTQQIQLYFGNFNPKYLFNNGIQYNKIIVHYQKILFLTNIMKDHHLFGIINAYQDGDNKNLIINYKNLILFGEKSIYGFNMKFGRIQLQWIQEKSYIYNQLRRIDKINPQIIMHSNSLVIQKPFKILNTNKKQYFLIYNSREIYYSVYNASSMETVSYYSLINDDFTIFRNNIGLTEIQDQEYMSVFNKKMVIKDIKYLNDGAIFVLYENSIIILEIGFNKSLVVRQELKFNSNQSVDIIKIQEFLQNYDKDSIFLRQLHGRIFILKFEKLSYKIAFHSHMDEDVLLFSKVSNWSKRQRSYLLQQLNMMNNYQQQLILKKDGQLLIKNMKKQQNNLQKNIYL